jgi:hypothetical protein
MPRRQADRWAVKDRLMMFNGAVFSLILTDLITSQTVQHVILMTIHGLSHVFGFGGTTPPGPVGKPRLTHGATLHDYQPEYITWPRSGHPTPSRQQ